MTWEQVQDRLTARYSEWPTPEVAIYEVAIVVLAVIAYRYLSARAMRVGRHFALIAVGVFALEFFTGPMWLSRGLGWWAYVYSDVTWLFTIAWTTMILCTVYAVDGLRPLLPSSQRFVLYLITLTPLTLLFEGLNTALGVREYAPETLAAAGPAMVPVLDVPVAGLYYIPVFMALILSFYKHWLPAIEPAGEPSRQVSVITRLLLTTLAVFMFEVVVEPMATNLKFPTWSYLVNDITIVMTGLWVVLVSVATFVIDRLLPTVDFRLRFAGYLGLISAIAMPIEAWFINNGFRVYGPSATADFIGVRTVILGLPIEVAAAIPIYLALVISFVRYWDGSVSRGLGLRPRASTSPGSAAMDVSAPAAG